MSYQYRAKFNSSIYQPREIVAGDYPIITEKVTIAAGQNLVEGSVLGRITASGKYVLSLAAATDGSQTPSAILPIDVDASEGDVSEIVWLSGQYHTVNLTFGTGHSKSTTKAALRDANIYLD